jgi:tetratricopeptide (TPR) repeat protein
LAAGIEADPTPNDHDCWLFAYMGLIKEKQGKMEEARQWFERTEGYVYWLSILPVKIDSKFLYGEFLLRQGEPGKALEKFNFILDNCPNDYRSWYGLALYHASRKENTLALDMLEKALERYYPIPGPIYKEPLFNKIRKTKRFKALMAKHFPKTTAQKN